MSWADKIIKNYRMNKTVGEIMNTKNFQDARKADMEQAALDAYCRFCLVTCDYLQMNFNCKRNGIMKFLKYASDVIQYTTGDDKYFEDMNTVMIDECGIDVMAELGVRVKKDDKG